jgi:hypothetical protein
VLILVSKLEFDYEKANNLLCSASGFKTSIMVFFALFRQKHAAAAAAMDPSDGIARPRPRNCRPDRNFRQLQKVKEFNSHSFVLPLNILLTWSLRN